MITTHLPFSYPLSILDTTEKLIKSLLNNKTRMFKMFSYWVRDWSYNGEIFDFIKELVEILMNNPIFFYFNDDKIVFIENKFMEMYVLTNDFNKYDIFTKNEIELLTELVKNLELEKVYSTRISFTKINLKDDEELISIRKKLCEWFILFDICKSLKKSYNIIQVEEIFNHYIYVLEDLKKKYKFKFIYNIIFALRSTVQ